MPSELGSRLRGGGGESFFNFFSNLSPHKAWNSKITYHTLHHQNRKTNKENLKTLGTCFVFLGGNFGGGIGLFVCLGKNLDVSDTVLRTCCLVLADSNNLALLLFERCYCNRHYSSEFGKNNKLREMLLHLLALACSLDL